MDDGDDALVLQEGVEADDDEVETSDSVTFQKGESKVVLQWYSFSSTATAPLPHSFGNGGVWREKVESPSLTADMSEKSLPERPRPVRGHPGILGG